MPRISPDKPLGGRYKLLSQLGVGGFGRTFLAEDLHLPGHPRCVIKHLKPQSKNDDTLQMARRCFDLEAQVLYRLGSHDQIPRLLAHFEENQEFYLAQEFIEGDALTRELSDGKPWSQGRVVLLIKDILQVLTFVHQQQVIHRDIKPSNLIRRKQDHKIVVIDFGAVKQVSTPGFDLETGLTNITISIGTQGYMPNEQLAGKPKFCSDIYAVGVLAIQVLTGIHPRHIGENELGEIAWHDCISPTETVDPALIAVLDQMVYYDFRQRYADATEALAAFEALPAHITENLADHQPLPQTVRLTDPTDTALQSTTTSPQDYTRHQLETATHPSDPFAQGDYGRGIGQPDHEPISTAVWPAADARAARTSLTQAIGRPYSLDTDPTTQPRLTYWQRALQLWSQPWSMVGLLSAGLVLVLAQTMLSRSSFNPGKADQATTALISPPDKNAPPEQQAASLIAQAKTLERQKRYAAALEAYRQAMKLKPNDIAMVGQAGVLLHQKQYDQAIKAYDEAIRLKPDSAAAHAGRCEAFNRLQQPEDALASCGDALAYRPNYPEALWSQGNARMLQNRPYDALRLYEDVTANSPKFAPGWVKRGVALQALGRSAESLPVLEQAIKLDRDSAEAWITKGEALLTLQRYDAALTALVKADQLQPDDPKVLQLRQQAKNKAK
jgi:eukaryotic-like serine/threonine-protein kinase